MKTGPITLLLLSLVFSGSIKSSVASDNPPNTMDLRSQVLVLNGYGEREMFWTDIYRAALYLPKESTAITFIRDQATAKAIRIRILYNEIPAKMPSDWREIFREELTRELLGKLKRAYRALEDNDVLRFSYQPGRGSEIWVNNERLLSDPGHDLMLGLVDQWLGERPVSKNLKRLMLSPGLIAGQ